MFNIQKTLSFKQWLIAAFAFIGILFAAGYLLSAQTINYLSDRSQKTAAYSQELNKVNLELSNQLESMERFSRQYLVLGDRTLFESFQHIQKKSLEFIGHLKLQGVISQELSTEWESLNKQLTQLQIGSTEPKDLQEYDQRLVLTFKTLGDLQRIVETKIQQTIESVNQALIKDIQNRQNNMRKITVILITLILLFSLALGLWLSRKFRSIEQGISQLGNNQFENPIRISGPPDLQNLGQKLDWLRLRLSELDADRSRFFRHTSHELKTPLAALKEGISLLDEEVVGPLTHDQKDIAHILQHNSQILENQIEDLLRFNAAAFESKTLNRQPTELRSLIQTQVDQQQLQWQSQQLEVQITGAEIEANIDPEKIATAISNLLANAIRFSPIGGLIQIHLSTEKGLIYLDLIDQGPGIAEEDCTLIFHPFYQGRIQAEGKTSGTGIGLSIVKEFIKAHGGEIELQPISTGTHFRIKLPYEHI